MRQDSIRLFRVTVLLGFLLLHSSLAGAQVEKVKVGLLMINADAGVFLAQEKGYFREQGLAVDITYFSSSGGPQMAALTTSELDVGSGSISPGIYNSVAAGLNMRVVASVSARGVAASTWCVVGWSSQANRSRSKTSGEK